MIRPDVRAMDHIGITVPNLDAASKFFEDVLGAQTIYDMLPEPMSGVAIEVALGVPEGTKLEAIRMMRLGSGPSLELFSYTADTQREPVRPSDFGIQHFAVFVDDIDAVAGRIAEHGGRILGTVDALPGGDEGPGNKFVYTHLPWGGTMELVEIPSPQAYETGTEIRRWKPPVSP